MMKGNADALERPIDVKFGPDGSMYIVDVGVLTNKHGQLRVEDGTGRILRLVPVQEKQGD